MADQVIQIKDGSDNVFPEIKKDGWNYFGTYQGTTVRDLPADANEYLVILQYGTSSGQQQMMFPFALPNESHLTGTPTQGYYLTSTSYAFAQIYYNAVNHTVQIGTMNISGTNHAATSYLIIYYR